MKKCLILFAAILLILTYHKNSIPEDALRIRIIPNSNQKDDQEMKQKVQTYLEMEMYTLLKDIKNTQEAKKVIHSNLPSIEEYITTLFQKNQYNMKYSINFGLNYFPKKKYKGKTYSEGYYDSLVITIGEGKGDNWWCVLFPPLCLLEAEEKENTEYTFFLKELFDKIF